MSNWGQFVTKCILSHVTSDLPDNLPEKVSDFLIVKNSNDKNILSESKIKPLNKL